MIFLRNVQNQIEKYLDLQQVLVLTGMRRVGKTTLLKYYFEQIDSSNKLYLNFEDILTRKIFREENYENILRSLKELGIHTTKKAFIFIDEIQYVDNAPSVIKYLYDEYDIKFFVTGSSSYYLRNKFSESLSGRKIIIEIFPLTFKEFLRFRKINKDYTDEWDEKATLKDHLRTEKYNDLFEEYMEFGGFPEVVLAKSAEEKRLILRDILTSYFQIDVAHLADFKDFGALRDLLILLTQRIGQRIDFTALASALSVKRDRIYEYLEFLQSTYVIKLLYQKTSVDNRISASGKLYFSDTGMANILEDIAYGNRLENAIFMNLRDQGDLTYFQTSTGNEIDFIVDKKIGLEVKSTPTLRALSFLKKRAVAAQLKDHYLVSNRFSEMDKLIMAWDV